jgi:hypothetical protein
MIISARKDKALYLLANDKIYWLATLSTNRADVYAYAKKYCKTANYKAELKKDGYKMVRVYLKELYDIN